MRIWSRVAERRASRSTIVAACTGSSFDLAGPRVVHELVDDGVELVDVQRHVGLAPRRRARSSRFRAAGARAACAGRARCRPASPRGPARPWRAARHAVEAHVDLADLAGHRRSRRGGESKSPSRMRLAANDSSLSGRLIRRAIAAEPSDGREQRDRQTQQHDACSSTSARRASGRPAASTSRSRSRSRPTGPALPFIALATIVSGPSWSTQLALDDARKRSTSNGSHLSVGSRGVSLTDSSVGALLMSATRLMPSVPTQRGAARG